MSARRAAPLALLLALLALPYPGWAAPPATARLTVSVRVVRSPAAPRPQASPAPDRSAEPPARPTTGPVPPPGSLRIEVGGRVLASS